MKKHRQRRCFSLLAVAHLLREISEALLVLRLGDRTILQKLIQQCLLSEVQLPFLFLWRG